MTVPPPAGASDFVNAVGAASDTDAWAVGTQYQPAGTTSRPLALHWTGARWVRTTTPASATANQSLFAVSTASATDAWAVGKSQLPGYSVGQTLALRWNGTAWSEVPGPASVPTGSLAGVADLGPTNAWAVGTLGRYNQLVEQWDGTAWSAVAVPTPFASNPVTKLTAVSARNASDVWAVGSYTGADTDLGYGDGAYALHWNGTAWSSSVIQAPSAGPATLSPTSVVAVGPNDAWAVLSTRLVGGQPVIAHWNGTAWTTSPTPSLGDYPSLTGVTARSATDVWAVGNYLADVNTPTPQRRTRSLHWNGSAWSIVPTNDTEADLHAIGAVPASARIWAVGTGAGAFLLTRTT
jgi:hypothetical protein